MKRKDLLEFTRMLSLLLNSGLGIKDAVLIMKTIHTSPAVKEFAAEISRGMDEGRSLSASIRRGNFRLSPIYLQLIGIGEKAGDIKLAVTKLCLFLERSSRLKDKIINSSIYPLLVLSAVGGSLILVNSFVIPRITEIYSSLGTPVPEKTERALSLTGTLSLLSAAVLIVIIAAASAVFAAGKINRRFLNKTSYLLLKLPIAGGIIRTVYTLYTLLFLEILTAAGAGIEEAVREAALILTYPPFKKALQKIHRRLLTGMQLSAAVSYEKVFPPEFSAWTAAGEATGNAAEVFSRLSIYYESQLENITGILLSLAEPALIAITGIILLGMVFFIVIPLFSSFGGLLQ